MRISDVSSDVCSSDLFSVASQVAERLELRLSHAFMLQSGTVRNAERVTAEEIRAMAQELENVLGGVYTVLSAEFQLPLIRRILYVLIRQAEAPELPKSVVPTVLTGFESIGRNPSAIRTASFLAIFCLSFLFSVFSLFLS